MMKAAQFWILIFGSVLVSFLLVRTVFISREVDRQQRVLVDNQEAVASATTWENNWKQLAIKVWQVGNKDPEMLDLLKSEGVGINIGTPPPAPPPLGGATIPSTSSKPTLVPHPTTP